MIRPLCLWFMLLAACAPAQTERSAQAPRPVTPAEQPAVAVEHPTAAQTAPNLRDPPDGMTLRLPMPGTSRETVLAAVHDQGPGGWQDDAEHTYRFHGWVRPLPQQCEDGCSWWTYRFAAGVLQDAELLRSVYDADADYAAQFTQEAQLVMTELEARLGRPASVEHLADWSQVEADEDGGTLVLERRTWALPELTVVATLEGDPGHHPGVILRIVVVGPEGE